MLGLASAPPFSPVEPVTDVLHGVSVTDHYRWLEDQDSPRTRQWIAEQTQYARGYLDHPKNREPLLLSEAPSRPGTAVHLHARRGRWERPITYRGPAHENAGPMIVSKPEHRSRFTPTGYSREASLAASTSSIGLSPARSMTQGGRSSAFCSLRRWMSLRMWQVG